MFRPYGLIPLIAAGASFLLAIVVYGAAPDRRLGRVFGFLALALVFWNLNIFALYAFSDYDSALAYSRLFRTGGVFLLPAILHLSLVLPGRTISPTWRIILLFDYAVSVLMVAINAAGLFVTQLATFYWGYYSVGTRYYGLFTASLILNFIGASSLLVYEYITTDEPRMRLQLKFWLLGMAIALPLGLTNLLPAYGVRFYPLGNLASAIWAAIVGYAIVRHRLMDIEVVVAKGLAYVSASIVVIGPGVVALVILQQIAFGDVHYDFTALVIVLFLLVGALFPRLQAATEARLGRSLFPNRFETSRALQDLSQEVVKILDRDKLLRALCERIRDVFAADNVAIYLVQDPGAFAAEYFVGKSPVAERFEQDHPLVRRLYQVPDAILREELESVPADARLIGFPVMTENQWDVVVPFRSGRELIGFLCIGPKGFLTPFTSGDLSLLGSVASGAGIALHNARLYGELQRSRAIISRASRLSAIGTLAAGIAHEMRNPLVSIQTFFQLAPQRLNDEEFMTSFLRLAEAEVQRIGNLISELLTFAKSPSPSLRSLNLSDIAERAVVLLEPQARTLGVTLNQSPDPRGATVLADADQMMQVVLNLALNAIQATSRGGHVCLEGKEVVEAGVRYCQLEIRDDGCGIPDSLRDAIFDPFFTTKEKGTGLGLAIAHQIVAECGGYISVSSEEGKGSRFIISVPAESENDEALDRPGRQAIAQ